MNLRSADIVLVRGRGTVSRLIRKLTRSPGEPRTRVSHVALAVNDYQIVEALGKVVVRDLKDSYKPHRYEVWRPKHMTLDERRKIVRRALEYVGNSYGYGKLALHALDGMLGGAYLFRRFAFVDAWPICSYLVASSYASVPYSFGVVARGATPDDLDDAVRTSGDFERVDL